MQQRIKELIRRFLPRTYREHKIRRGPLRGAPIVTSWHDYPGAIRGTTEAPLLHWFDHNVAAGETWLDIGAHYGYTALALSRLVGPTGHVLAFEPILASAACIAQTKRLNHLDQLDILPIALSDKPRLCPLSIPTFRGMADGTLAPGHSIETIYTVALDSVWDSFCWSHLSVHGAKIDVQGMEDRVLAGMRHLLTRHQPKLIVEFHRGVDRSNVVRLLRSCGYQARGVEVGAAGAAEHYEDDASYDFAPPSGKGDGQATEKCARTGS